MKKNAFTMVEIAVVISLLMTTVLLCLPFVFNNTKQARLISGWKNVYSELKPNFEIFEIDDYNAVKRLCSTNIENMEGNIFKILSPYLNVDVASRNKPLKGYHYRFSNGAQIPFESKYFTRNFYERDNGVIIGFKWINCNCDEIKPCAAVVFDMNGKKPPNRLGQDVFGLHIYKDNIKAFGSDLSNVELERECVKNRGTGAPCSEFYLRGGKF